MVQSISNINRLVRQIGMADESQYFIQIDDYSEEAFVVETVSVERWALTNADYELKVKVLALNSLDPNELLNKKANIKFLWRGSFAPLIAIVSEVFEANGNGDHPGYMLTLRCPLAVLKLQSENRVYLEKSSLDVARELLDELSGGSFTIEVKASEPVARAMIVQYQENDWDFLYRILLRDGIMIHVHQETDAISVHLFDDVAQLPDNDSPLELPYRDSRGAAVDEEYVSLVRHNWQVVPMAVQITDYQAKEALPAFGREEVSANSAHIDHRWAENTAGNDATQLLAEKLAIAHRARQHSLLMHTTCRGLRPGMTVTLTGHPNWNGDYLITQMECQGQQVEAVNSGVAGQSKGYQNSIIAIPAGIAFLPVLPKRQVMAGTLNACISAEVDQTGHYQVRLPFDGESPDSLTSLPTTLIQPFGGRDHGMHFPLTKGTDVVVGFDNGDVDRPVILGAAQNNINPSVVTSENAYQNVIRTRGKHEFLLDDTPGHERIQLNTEEQKNRLLLNATQDAHLVELHSEDGDLQFTAGRNINLESGTDMAVSVGGNQEVTVAGDYRLMTEEGDVVHQAGNSILMTAQENIEWGTEQGDVKLESGSQWHVEAAQGISTHVVEGDHNTVVENGHLAVEVAENINIGAVDSITLSQGGGSITIDNSGNISIEGPQVEINANKIAIKGGNVGNN